MADRRLVCYFTFRFQIDMDARKMEKYGLFCRLIAGIQCIGGASKYLIGFGGRVRTNNISRCQARFHYLVIGLWKTRRELETIFPQYWPFVCDKLLLSSL